MSVSKSKKVLLLCAHRPGRSPSQRYRFEQYLSFLEGYGYSFTFSYLLNEKQDRLFYSKGNSLKKALLLLYTLLKRMRDVFRFHHFQIVFIQREAHFFGISFFERKAFQSGAYVIFDFDDSIWLADTSPGNQKWEWVKQPKKFYTNVSYAHTVLAGNAYLKQEAQKFNKNVVLLPTTVDTTFHVPKMELRDKNKICIGWSGSLSTIKHFELLLPVLKLLQKKYKESIYFKLIGEKNYHQTDLDLVAVPWTAETEVDELNTFHIGLMPLMDDAWSKGKCGLKGLTYMACEIPVVMSAVGVNSEIVQQGENGYLAKTEEDWLNMLSTLIENESLRKEFGRKGRETVVKNYSVERYKGDVLSVFENANAPR